MTRVGDGIGLDKQVLMRICKLYGVPTPPKCYFQTSIARRSVRIIRLPLADSKS
jgi:hypothetical protein